MFGDRLDDCVNRSFSFETTSTQATWTPLPGLGIRQDVIHTFRHNNLIYLVGWQWQSKTMIQEYNPLTESWRTLLTELNGTVRPGTMLRKYLINECSFLETQEKVKYKSECLESRPKMPISQR